MVDVLKAANFFEELKANGYSDLRPISETEWVGILPLLFTHAIIRGTLYNTQTYDDRWCYHTYGDALIALQLWDPAVEREPKGWHRHPMTGRRKCDDGTEEVRF